VHEGWISFSNKLNRNICQQTGRYIYTHIDKPSADIWGPIGLKLSDIGSWDIGTIGTPLITTLVYIYIAYRKRVFRRFPNFDKTYIYKCTWKTLLLVRVVKSRIKTHTDLGRVGNVMNVM
jgi:hypothetical protein